MNDRFIIIIVVLIFSLNSCIEPFDATIGDYKDLLVVEGSITNENKSHYILLSRSADNISEPVKHESKALVVVEDDLGNKESLTEVEPGLYKTDSLQFHGTVGRTYVLSIRTNDGKLYQSEPCMMNQPSPIDSVYPLAGKGWNNNGEEKAGIDILVDATGNDVGESYLRWTYDEDWKFSIKYPVVYIILPNDSAVRIDPVNIYCWKSDVSTEIMIHSFQNQDSRTVKGRQLCFIPTGENDKISIRYSTLVRQYSISKKEYEFWNKLKVSTEDVGDIFSKQPFSISGNVKCIDNPKEPVLGFFQVAGVTSKRIYINQSYLFENDLPVWFNGNGCPSDSFLVDGVTFHSSYQIYTSLVLPGSRSLVEPIYDATGKKMLGLMLTYPTCADCTLTGDINPPSFWERY